ncbi:hypothetical protein B31L_1066 [Bifidobacterium breve 31L]|nr:hypothetical protein B31L_1066 [Bifidobacterium breve 31L]
MVDCTNCSKLAPVGNNALEYNDPSENSERNTGQYSSITATKHTTANPKASAQRRIRRILRWARSRGLSNTSPFWAMNASRRSWNCLICWRSAVSTCNEDMDTLDCRVTRLRDRMAPAMEVNANHGRHSCTHASYGFLRNNIAMAMPKLRNKRHSHTTIHAERAMSVYRYRCCERATVMAGLMALSSFNGSPPRVRMPS